MGWSAMVVPRGFAGDLSRTKRMLGTFPRRFEGKLRSQVGANQFFLFPLPLGEGQDEGLSAPNHTKKSFW